MPPYSQIHLDSLLFMLFVGLGLAIAVILARGSDSLSFSFRERTGEDDEHGEEFGGDVRERNRPVPWLIWFVFGGYFIWAVSYVLFIGARGL
jgi:hypothetical protein